MFVTPSFEILPAEMLYIICRRVLLSDTKGTRLARAARIFTPFVKEASADLTRTQCAWWSGVLPPPRPVCTEEEHSSALLEVRGLGEADVDTIAGQGVWVNNFSLVAAFVALGYAPLLISPLSGACITPPHLWQRWDRSDDTVLLGPELTARQPGLRDMFGTPFGPGTFWGVRDVRRRVASAKFVLCPVNTDNIHWAALNINVELRLAEVFESASGCTNLQFVHHVVKYVSSVQNISTEGWNVVVRCDPAWTQEDGTSCGIYTIVVIKALLEYRRVMVLQSDVLAWREHLAALIHSHIQVH